MKCKSFSIFIGAFMVFNVSFACEIENKTKIHRGMKDGVAGVCSNNGREIDCINSGFNQGGITCRGPEGTNSGYDLQSIIYAVCGCTQNDLQQQLDAEME